ncbi:MAG: 50S ribosomal protein L6 [Gammaproteobacteria bacterium]|nr:50S ribosomal protein L6 [Gammaproteobacteria bacterium]
MSRIGKKAINVPQGTTVEIKDNFVSVKGPKGELSHQFKNDVVIELKDNQVHVTLPEHPTQFSYTYHGTARALINNMVQGCSEGFKIALEIKGTGYRATLSGNQLTLIVGYSNPQVMQIPEGLKVELPTQTDIVITGYNKQVLGEFAALVRGVRPPEPYLGKGIRYKGENVRRKEGKTAK